MANLPLNIDYSGKVVVVTGAGGVLCSTMARAFAQSGAKVAALDLNEEAVKKLAEELKAEGYVCEGYKANVLDPEALEAVHRAVLADLGPCDILVNGAGGNNPRATTDKEYFELGDIDADTKSFFDLDASGVEFVFNLNFLGTLIPTQAFARQMMSSYWFGDVEDYKRFSGDTLREYKRYFSDYDYTQWDNDDFLEQKQLFGMTKWSNSLCQKFQKLCQEMEQAIVGWKYL